MAIYFCNVSIIFGDISLVAPQVKCYERHNEHELNINVASTKQTGVHLPRCYLNLDLLSSGQFYYFIF